MREVFICDAARTPIGRYGGALAKVRTDDLAAVPIKALVARNAKADWSRLDEVFSAAPISPARTTAMSRAWRPCSPGCPTRSPASPSTGCAPRGSTRSATPPAPSAAARWNSPSPAASNSMTRAPFVMAKAGEAFSRSAEIYDTTLGWRFINPLLKAQYGVDSMAETGENVAEEFQVTRADQDAFALRSQARAAKAKAVRLFRRRDRAGRGAGRQSRSDYRRPRRASAAGHHAGKLAEAQTDRAQSRHHHRRQCFGHQ